MKTPARFETIRQIRAGRDRYMRPDMFQKGDLLSVGILPSITGRCLIQVYNHHGTKVQALYNKSYSNEAYARRKAAEFADRLSAQ